MSRRKRRRGWTSLENAIERQAMNIVRRSKRVIQKRMLERREKGWQRNADLK
nr:MAG TPA: hypothetical protein [Caudoviricetes sp.]